TAAVPSGGSFTRARTAWSASRTAREGCGSIASTRARRTGTRRSSRTRGPWTTSIIRSRGSSASSPKAGGMGSGPRYVSASDGNASGRNPRAGLTQLDISVFRYRNVDLMRPFAWKMHGRRGLRMWTLSLISRSPKNWADVVDAIEQMTQGWRRPSPGSSYPLLADLEREGLIQKRADGRYELNPKVREEFEWVPGMGRRRPQGIPEMVSEMEGYVSYFEDLN